MVRVAGVDGCRGGWVVAASDGTLAVVESLAAILDEGFDAVAIDIPIGLPDAGPRRCDVEARRLLGPRRSTVFPAPARRFVDARSFTEVEGMSLQAFHLLPRIAEVDRLIGPELQERVVESHPELAFARLAGGVALAEPKRTPPGVARRRDLLGLGHVPRVRGAGSHDVLDALALVVTAGRIARSVSERLGGDRDGRGLRMEIAW